MQAFATLDLMRIGKNHKVFGLREVPESNVMRITYEDLIDKGAKVLGEVAAFAALKPD